MLSVFADVEDSAQGRHLEVLRRDAPDERLLHHLMFVFSFAVLSGGRILFLLLLVAGYAGRFSTPRACSGIYGGIYGCVGVCMSLWWFRVVRADSVCFLRRVIQS